ncbi:MAG: NAD(+) synthase [Syntrophales bacterium]|jgi:NAD+ synthase (glutamine-hydrolysing)|nr:NAD(+) synthase [Syntrophales bacterium]MCK9527153.1 NAD(+) synthase [Syntrophales bacterium]MDX9921722.1 NAD(+) synthase [Syntrophales bacterium]
MNGNTFFNLYRHGFFRAALCVPEVRVADPAFNGAASVMLARRAAGEGALLALFPELGLSAYSNEDLFHQEALLTETVAVLHRTMEETADLNLVLVLGAPLKIDSLLFNCAIVLYRGNILGVAVKSYLPNYREYYEARQFSPAGGALSASITLCGRQDIPFGADLLFNVSNIPNFTMFIEIGEDLRVPVSPSNVAALAGATILGNLSASNITAGKSELHHTLVAGQSARCIAAYLCTAAGYGESTTDMAWDGHGIIYENGTFLAGTGRFSREAHVVCADIDLDRLSQDRMRTNSFAAGRNTWRDHTRRFRTISFDVDIPSGPMTLSREYSRFPYIPLEPEKRDIRCHEIFNIQTHSLAKRLEASGIENLVIGVSGGLDSSHALIVAARTMDLLHRPRSNIKAYTMPGFATSQKTYENSLRLMESLGVEAQEIDIRPSCLQMMKDIGHPFADGTKIYDTVFENIQAGERTSHLFRIANLRGGLVVGTADMSELALGWSTYGVGDHMAHYNVNAGIPKTLMIHLVRWVAGSNRFGPDTAVILEEILETGISPELVPGSAGQEPSQMTEAVVGPYELQDFNTFYITRFGYLPTKVAFMAYCAWRDRNRGSWPDIPEHRRNEYSIGEIKAWLLVYLNRFFKTSQFKRTCVPNSPKTHSGGSLSPRGDYRAPSDSEAAVWLDNAALIPETDDEQVQ